VTVSEPGEDGRRKLDFASTPVGGEAEPVAAGADAPSGS
jgi:hypothetical protein